MSLFDAPTDDALGSKRRSQFHVMHYDLQSCADLRPAADLLRVFTKGGERGA